MSKFPIAINFRISRLAPVIFCIGFGMKAKVSERGAAW